MVDLQESNLGRTFGRREGRLAVAVAGAGFVGSVIKGMLDSNYRVENWAAEPLTYGLIASAAILAVGAYNQRKARSTLEGTK